MQAEVWRCQQGIDVGADGVEGNVTEVEQARIADDDIQPQCQEDIKNREVCDAYPRLAAKGSNERNGEQDDADEHHCQPMPLPGSGLLELFVHARSPVRSPKRPEGRNISTTIRTMKAKISW